MRIHSDNTDHYLQALALTANRDPLSLSGWQCVRVMHCEGLPRAWYANTLATMKDVNPEVDCDVVHCADNDILFISRDKESFALHELADDLNEATLQAHGVHGEVHLYSLMSDRRCLSDLFLNKAPLCPPEMPPRIGGYDFGDIGSLREVFSEAVQKRRARSPLHVMIVEDDALTRRIVANSFKEEFALISATNAQEAVANYLLHAPDIVFLDIGLPDTSGFNVLHQILTTDPNAYVVMFSGNSYLDNVTTALNAGASGFVAKPFKKDVMRHYITTSAEHHRKPA